jgi:hypothetical protein
MWIGILLAALAVGSVSGCSRTVLVSESSPMRVGPETKARIYTRQEGEWILSENSVTIPEGWYLVPPSYVEK